MPSSSCFGRSGRSLYFARSSAAASGRALISRMVWSMLSTSASTALAFFSRNSGLANRASSVALTPSIGRTANFAGRALHDDLAVRRVEDRGLDVALDQGAGAHLRARHVADALVLDAVLVGGELHHRLRAGAARVDRDLLAVEVLPGLVELGVDDRVEAQRAHLVEQLHRRAHLLEHRVGRADPDVGLAAEHGLRRDVLRLHVRDLDRETLLLGALHGDEEVERFHGGDVAEGDPKRRRSGPGTAGRRPGSRARRRRRCVVSEFSMTVLPMWRPFSGARTNRSQFCRAGTPGCQQHALGLSTPGALWHGHIEIGCEPFPD